MEAQVGTLTEAKIGKVYNFNYRQPYGGDTRRCLAKVVEIRKLTDSDIARITNASRYRVGDPEFIRTETIVTCQMPDGQHRNFYAERTDGCKRTVLGSILFWTGLARLMFRR